MTRSGECNDGIPLLWIGGWSIDPYLHPLSHSETHLLSKRIIPVDLSACESPSEFIQAATRTIANLHTEVDIAAWSLGTVLALKVQTLLGNRIRRMVLFSATPKFTRDPSTGWTTGLAAGTMRSMKRRLQVDRSQALTAFHLLMLAPHGSPDAGALISPNEYQTEDPISHSTGAFTPGTSPWSTQALVAGLDVLETFDLRDCICDVHARTLLIHGTDDRVCPVGAGRWVADRLHNAEMVEVDGAGHFPHLFRNPEIHRRVEVFLS